MPKISVVIPWREHPSRVYAYNMLISWYFENYPDIQIIISDSESKKFNPGVARNAGAKKAIEAGTDIIIFNDADTFCEIEKLQHAIAHAQTFNEITLPYSSYYQHRSNRDTKLFFQTAFNKNLDVEIGYRFVKPVIKDDGLPKKLYPCSGVLVVPANIFNAIGGFAEDIEGWGPEDTFLHRQYFDMYGKLFTYIDGVAHATFNDPKWRVRNPEHQKYLNASRLMDLRNS